MLQVLRDGRLLVEDQSSGGQTVVAREGLTASWDGGTLRFVGRGAGGEGVLPTAYTIADFHLVPALLVVNDVMSGL